MEGTLRAWGGAGRGGAGERKNKNKTDPGQFGKRKTEMQRGFFLCWVSVPPNTVQILSEVFSFCAVGFRSRFVVVVGIARPQRLCFRVSSSPPPTPAALLFFLCLISGNVTATKTKQRGGRGKGGRGARGVHLCGLGANHGW